MKPSKRLIDKVAEILYKDWKYICLPYVAEKYAMSVIQALKSEG